MKRSLNWYGFLFSYAWKSLSISFGAIAFCWQFYFLFCVKDSLNRKKFVYHTQPTTCLTLYRAIWFTHIFFSAWKLLFIRCLVLCFSLFYFRYIVIYYSYLCCFTFYFTVKTALVPTLTSQTFFFPRENSSLFLIKFLNKTNFSDVAALLFLLPIFFFFFVKTSLRSLLISPYIRASAFHAVPFFVCVKFSLNKKR